MKKVVIIDFGSQYTMLIARRIRELGVFSEIVGPSWPEDSPNADRVEEVGAIVLSGGPMSVLAPSAPRVSPKVFEFDIPILGICYGHQMLAHLLGGQVTKAQRAEYGWTPLEVIEPDDLFFGLPAHFRVWMSHGDEVQTPPPGFTILARTPSTPVAAMRAQDRPIVGVQFHPEVVHTQFGKTILANFLFRIAKLQPTWRMSDFLTERIQEIQSLAQKGMFLVALSGGVDSSVLTQLLAKAAPDRLVAVFVDTGLLKWDEPDRIRRYFGHLPHLIMVDAKDRFFQALQGVTDPEEKRKVIGALFAEIFEEEARKWQGQIRYLAQGTLYPDVIESGQGLGPAATIKTHHNVGGLPEDLSLELYEPFRYLFKDEVRQLGRHMGLPEDLIQRHPFPGPGFAVRVIGEVTPADVALLQKVDRILEEEIKQAGLYTRIWQAFPVLLPIRSVGVTGDERSYGRVVVIRAVTSVDGMTADWFAFPDFVLKKISSRITGEIREINRVVYDITSKPPGTIEWE